MSHYTVSIRYQGGAAYRVSQVLGQEPYEPARGQRLPSACHIDATHPAGHKVCIICGRTDNQGAKP